MNDVALSAGKPNTPPILPHDPAESAQPERTDEGRYVGSTHWSAILDDIHELKAVLGAPLAEQDNDDPVVLDAPVITDDIIFGDSTNYSLTNILTQYLPPRIEVDRAISLYFRGETFIVPFIHTYQFQRQYQAFWADISNVDPLWLSSLFSLCYIATLIGSATGAERSSQEDLITRQFRLHTAAAQSLVLGKYHRPQPFAVEALALYGHCKNLRSLDPCREAGTILGLVVRKAYEMGYHRDPDSGGSFSVFEGEMRRRSWSVCKQYDSMVSFQLGLPSYICLENTDTKPPRNLIDSDFDEDTAVLPPSRPANEATRMLWFIVKDRLLGHFSKVCRDALSFKERSEAEINQLDHEIRQMQATIPDILRIRPLTDSLMDPPFLVMNRLFLEFMSLKSLLVLHRKYMARGNHSSTRSCVDAGTKLELAPGGQLYTERWMLNNFTVNDFLLGVMVLCLLIHTHRKGGCPRSEVDSDTEIQVLALLQQSYTICVEKSSESKDAWRVSHAIRLTLNGGRTSNAASQAGRGQQLPSSAWTPVMARSSEHPWPPSSPLSLSDDFQQELDGAAFETLDPFNFMFNDLTTGDWLGFDSQIWKLDDLSARE
ncbi:hypothetical protein LTR10_018092 [Elasticomyces elasticus]|uniref:Xylanolytic transcriptional activator regulatory domain-containing protein n=1 Tax=Exophiala sideris TaxID=1016849 RepID=A0ABR0IW58_9EURO|nr:hypothetical protein LTR10_018092 [Elasticomyces elasticus]KAK5021689.1 hypothetical protein LTS07_010731 [Exophiala sideris]KAK5025156.1 hypothetical protein LTR13_010593 [Exophiala sideris]KAK5050120.1 hypothetical protein LTR69_010754 [Exophiala sideris]KAK5176868.1 hypothetical protein LTR44_010564 [Eurotiomycetes sp. CCFEE 6388]